ncbi:MAG: hypothetical protein CMN72_01510 [Sphingomonas sp.]|nr:hypothetical protein [Sphingomonas sp.]
MGSRPSFAKSLGRAALSQEEHRSESFRRRAIEMAASAAKATSRLESGWLPRPALDQSGEGGAMLLVLQWTIVRPIRAIARVGFAGLAPAWVRITAADQDLQSGNRDRGQVAPVRARMSCRGSRVREA